MNPKIVIPIALVAVAGGVALWLRRDGGAEYYTGFVEGEERVLRSEVTGRVLEIRFAEGARVAAGEIVAVLDSRDVESRLETKRRELAVLDVDIATQQERVALVEATWKRDLSARKAELSEAKSAAELAAKTHARERALVETAASTKQLLDETQSRTEQATSAVERARQMLGRAEAEERAIALARSELAGLREKRAFVTAQLGELEVLRTKYDVRAPAAPTVVQTQYLWPGELAQPGSALLAVLDPADKYVQVYLPVAELGKVRVGQPVEVELDSRPETRFRGEVSFIADSASFTPEKIETRDDRLGQVYRAKVRLLEGAEELKPGTEGNVYLVATETAADGASAAQVAE